MFYVYAIQSLNNPEKFYVGYTLDINARLQKHNEGGSIYTKDNRPWALVFSASFVDKIKALNFEKYLKSHSGRIFAKKRLW